MGPVVQAMGLLLAGVLSGSAGIAGLAASLRVFPLRIALPVGLVLVAVARMGVGAGPGSGWPAVGAGLVGILVARRYATVAWVPAIVLVGGLVQALVPAATWADGLAAIAIAAWGIADRQRERRKCADSTDCRCH